MIDRTTKLLLAAIAVGLFFNVAVPLIQPTEVMAEEAQRGPRGRGAVQPQVQGNVQSEEDFREQQAARTEAALDGNPGSDTDTDRWLRLIRLEMIEFNREFQAFGSIWNDSTVAIQRQMLQLLVNIAQNTN